MFLKPREESILRRRSGPAVLYAVERRWKVRTKILSFRCSDLEVTGDSSKHCFGGGEYWGQKLSWRGLSNAWEEKMWNIESIPLGEI